METDRFPNDRNSGWKKNISADLSNHTFPIDEITCIVDQIVRINVT